MIRSLMEQSTTVSSRKRKAPMEPHIYKVISSSHLKEDWVSARAFFLGLIGNHEKGVVNKHGIIALRTTHEKKV